MYSSAQWLHDRFDWSTVPQHYRGTVIGQFSQNPVFEFRNIYTIRFFNLQFMFRRFCKYLWTAASCFHSNPNTHAYFNQSQNMHAHLIWNAFGGWLADSAWLMNIYGEWTILSPDWSIGILERFWIYKDLSLFMFITYAGWWNGLY